MQFFILSIFFSLCLYSAEIARIESISNDIEELREDYLQCKRDLISPQVNVDMAVPNYKTLLNNEKKKNSLLISKIDLMKTNNKSDKILNNLNSILKTKEKEINSLKKEINNLEKEISNINKNKENNKYSLVIPIEKETICAEENQFPQLLMKTTAVQSVEIVKEFTPATFRLDKNTGIYNSIKGTVVESWKKGKSFTSNIMTQNWIKVTGYFHDGMWMKSKDELWIKKENIIKR